MLLKPYSLLFMSMVLLLAICSCAPNQQQQLAVKNISIWNMPAYNKRVPAPRTLIVDKNDNLIVLDNAGRLIRFNPDGKVMKIWSMPDVELGHPEGVCQLADGRLVVADTHYNRIVVFKKDGRVDNIWGQKGTEEGMFSNPVGVCTDPDGNLYTCEYGDCDRIQKFTVDGKLLMSFGQSGTGQGQFQRPSGLFWNEDKIYVADAVNDRIQIFSDDGKYLKTIDKWTNAGGRDSFYLPYDICHAANGAFYVVEYGNSRICKFDREGQFQGAYGTTGAGRRQLETPWGVAADSRGRVFIADTGNRRIVVLE